MSFFLLNTNKKQCLLDHKTMVEDKTIAMFGHNYVEQMYQIQKNDIVFLYESKAGIIACGQADGNNCDTYNSLNELTRYQKLNNFILLEKPLTSQEINKILNRTVFLNKTLSPMPDGHIIYDFILNK